MSVIAGVALFSLILSLVASLVVPFTASAATATLFTNGFESSNFSAWTAANYAPVALDDSYSGNEDTTVTTGNVLINDIDIEGDALSVVGADTTTDHGGTVVNNGDGTFTVTPPANYHGYINFNYTVSDGSATDQGLVSILVSNTNDAPVAVADTYSVNEDAVLTVPVDGVLTNDSDVDGGALAATLVNDVSNGTLTLNTDGSFTYTPDANYNGSDSFTYHANDNASAFSGDVVVTITINPSNDAPVAANQSLTTVEDSNLSGSLSATDIDVPANTLTFSTTSNPTNGTLTLDANTGAFVYTPNTDYVGADSFTFQVSDGALSSATDGTVSITVTAAPVIPVVVVAPPSNGAGSGGNGGGGGSVVSGPFSIGFVNTNTGGQVLGTSTEEALPAGCELYIKTYMKMGAKNDTTEVKKLQTFLNTHMNASLPVTGIFGPLTFAAVNAFQLKHWDEVLAPWVAYGLPTDHTPTGYVYKTTKRMVNLVQCNNTVTIPKPQLP